MDDLVCKHLIDDICCNPDCPVCCDFCPVYNYFEICKYAELVDVIHVLEDIPAADVRPVVRGKWLPYEFGDYHWHKCSVCGVADKFIETVYRKGFIDTELFSARNFCPHCGADMRGDHGNGNKT